MAAANGELDLTQIEATLIELVQELEPAPVRQRGRPRILPAALLWASLTIGILRGKMSQAAVWRLTKDKDLWRGEQIAVSDQAVYKRLAQQGPSPMEALFHALTARLVARVAPCPQNTMAPFASAVVAIDESTLDQVMRKLPALHQVPLDDARLLPGKIAGVFDLRTNLWRTARFIDYAHQNEKVAALDLISDLAPGALILADMGYFKFAWFDTLTDAGHFWISRVPAKVSFTVVHTLIQTPTLTEDLVFFGGYRSDRSAHRVRRIQVTIAHQTWTYVTNVEDPRLLPSADVVALYRQRWKIESAFNLAKTHLHLHLIWSAKPSIVQHQVWAVLLIAQLVGALRAEIATRAAVPIDDVSLALLVSDFPRYAAGHDDPIAAYIADGFHLRYIRKTRTKAYTIPIYPHTAYVLPPPDSPITQTPRYARVDRRSTRGPGRN